MAAGQAGAADKVDTSKILCYNPDMEYRACGKTGMMVSCVAMGGHWKRIDTVVEGMGQNWLGAPIDSPAFIQNRTDVVTRCMERGINWIDACTVEEVKSYARALKGRRDKMHLACSWYQKEMRNPAFRTEAKLLETLDWGLKDAGLEYADLWRITMHEQSADHADGEVEEMMKALAKAKQQGKARFTGFSSHHREHIRAMIEKYPEVVDIVVTPYTARTQEMPADSVFAAMRERGVGFFGIKPFASNSLFKGDSRADNENAEEDDRRARLALRFILCNPVITAPIPGLINLHQVDNAAKAVLERRTLDAREKAEPDRAMDEAWAKLPADYHWLKCWDYA